MINPLLENWDEPFGLPPFERVKPEHFAPAFEQAMAAHDADIDRIANASAAPTFENTIAALDRSGRLLRRIEQLFFNLTASETSPQLQEVERNFAPRLAAHENAILLNQKLFARIDELYSKRETLSLSVEQTRLLERVHLDSVLAGARLSAEAKSRLSELVKRLAQLQTAFSQNVLADEAEWCLWLNGEDDLRGLPESVRAAAKTAAEQRDRPQAFAITLSRSLVVPFLTHSQRRDLREQAFNAWTRRGENDGSNDNRPIAREILKLRAEQARLNGYASYADYALVDRMAGKPDAVAKLLENVWEPAKAKAAEEVEALRAVAAARGEPTDIAPWDWRYYSELVRKQRYDIDDAMVKPYFALDRMVEAAFDCANRLFGIEFVRRADIVAYHPDVQVYEVRRGEYPIGVFLHDNFARPTKRGGAWMGHYRSQSRIEGDILPIVVNNNNFAKGAPTLLSLDDVRTLFHEFGHGLHGLLSQVTYERLSGTRVLRDFVELPSQLFEHWAVEPEVLKKHALHVESGEPIPDELIKRLQRAEHFNQGFATVEYTACALLDMALHSQTPDDGVDITQFERDELARLGMPREIMLRHRLPHFSHLFSSSSYAAGYYVYMWAEVLDADGFNAFVEKGNPFDPTVAARLFKYVYSSGNTIEPGAAYRAFRGRDPTVEPLLNQRGLIEPQPA
ncbi:MAG TPA: M3 family metallopeptidase [Burkholderiaceae bacterium]|nr:M3 family metallopeptidase [Burkholderiaceae bacterium]